MIWHVIKKDFRALWWLAPSLLVAAVGYAYAFAYRMGVHDALPGAALIALWPYATATFCVARVVQIDSPAIQKGDWQTRPISRLDILIAKALIALFGVLLPWGLIDFAWGLDWGLDPAGALAGAAVHMTSVATGLLLIMAVAAVTRSLIPFLLSGALLIAGMALIIVYGEQIITQATAAQVRGMTYMSSGLLEVLVALAALALLGAIFLLYGQKRIRAAWVAVLVATLGVAMIDLTASQLLARHWPPVVETAIAHGLTVAAAGPPVLRQVSPNLGFVSIPLTITKPAQAQAVSLEVDRLRITRTWQTGRTFQAESGRGGVLGFDVAVGTRVANRATPLLKRLDTLSVSPNSPEPQRLDVSYRLRVRTPLPAVTLTGDGPIALPGGGTCRIMHGDPNDYRVSNRGVLQCISATPLCLDVQRPSDPPYAKVASGCGNDSRALRGFYEQRVTAGFGPLGAGPFLITRYRQLGLIDRGFSLPWTTPIVQPYQPPPKPPLATSLAPGISQQ